MRRPRALLSLLAIMGTTLIALAPPASAGGILTITVEKEVVGTAPAGTTFTVRAVCAGQDDPVNLTFDATGAPLGQSSFQDVSLEGCAITEIVNGGATTTTFECTSTTPPASCQPIAGGIQVSQSSAGGAATVTVTNTFVPSQPPAAGAIGAQPSTVG